MGSGRFISSECQNSSCYKWMILVAGCTTMFLRAIFINGTLPVLSVYYEEKFSDRKLSSLIGSIQTSISFIACFPAMLICRKIEAGKIQIIGGILSCVEMTCTAFSTAAWQALIANGFVTGIGGACLYAGCYNAVAGYFTGHQLAPFVALSTSFSLGALATPQIIKKMIATMGFRYCLLTSACMMLLNLVTGIIHRQPSRSVADDEDNSNNTIMTKRKINLKFTGGKMGIFHASALHDLEDNNMKVADSDVGESGHSTDSYSEINDRDETLSNTKSDTSIEKTLIDTSSEDLKINECELEGSEANIEQTLHSLLTKAYEYKMAINYILGVFCAYAGYVAYLGNLGDYSKYALGFSDEVYTTAITILGAARLVTGLVYTVVARHVILSSLCMYATNVALQAVVVFCLISRPDEVPFYFLMGLIGVFQSMFSSAMYGCCIEVTSPDKAPYMFMIQTIFDGLGSIVAPYITAYLQVEVDIDAGLYFAGGIMILSSVILLPSVIASLRAPKTYSAYESVVSDKLYQTGYVPRPYQI